MDRTKAMTITAARADRVVVKANRTLPERYDEDYFDPEADPLERDALIRAYISARDLGLYTTADRIGPLLIDLPVPVLRDIIAADGYGHVGAAGTVAATFTRAAALLEQARLASTSRSGDYYTPQPGDLLTDVDLAFVDAIRAKVAIEGGELLLPPVPALPDWINEEEHSIAQTFGWLRLAVGYTTGRKLHAPGCHSLNPSPIALCGHVPWWLITLEDGYRVCARCGGPGIRDLVALAGFAAAADVWQARDRDHIENWQQEALQRLIATTAASRARILEPDVTLAARIVDALSRNAPTDDGRPAYALAAATLWNRLGNELEVLSPEQREAARRLLHDRLAAAESVLPERLRPEPLPQDASPDVLRERYTAVKATLKPHVPQIDRLLFTLSDPW